MPIGALILLLAVETLALVRRQPLAGPATTVLLVGGVVGCWLAGFTGWFAARGFVGPDVFIHRWSGVALTIVVSVTWWLWWRLRRQAVSDEVPRPAARWYVFALLVILALLIVTGHYGNILVRDDPDWLWSL